MKKPMLALTVVAALVLAGCNSSPKTEAPTAGSSNPTKPSGAPDISKEWEAAQKALKGADNAPKAKPGQSSNTGAIAGATYEGNTSNQIRKQELDRQTDRDTSRASMGASSALDAPTGGGPLTH
jgi:hypothetical protein